MLKTLILAALICPLTACHDRTSTAPTTSSPQPSPVASAPLPMPGPPINGGLSKASLSLLFQANLEERHQQPEAASQHYLVQAYQHSNRTLALYAWRTAQQASSDTLAQEATTLWQKLYRHAEKNHDVITAADMTMMRALCEQAMQTQQWSDALYWQLSLDEHGDSDAINSMLETWVAAEQPMPREALHTQIEAYQKQHPNYKKSAVVSAALLAGEGHTTEAIQQLNRILQHHSDNLDALFAKALIEQRLGLQKAALKTVDTALVHSGDHQEYRFALLRIDLELESHDTAAADRHIDQLVHQLPESVLTINGLAQFLLDHRHAEATQHLLDRYPLTEEETRNDALQANRQALQGITADQLDNVTLAQHAFSLVTPSSPLFAHAQLRLLALAQKHDGSEAASHLMRSQRERFPNQASLLVPLELSALQHAQQFDKANALLEQAVNDYPEHDDLRYLRAMQRMTHQQVSEGLDDLRLLIQHQPNNPFFLNAYGYSLADQKQDYAQALPLLQKSIELAPNNAEIQDSLGWTLHGMGRNQEARQWLARAYEALPSLDVAQHYLEVLVAMHEGALAQQVMDHLYHSTPLNETEQAMLKQQFPMLRQPTR